MKDVLQEIVDYKKIEVAEFKRRQPLASLEREVTLSLDMPVAGGSMRNALATSQSGIIAEFKRRSPSKGWINQAAEASDVPFSYQNNGATAISVLTDEHYFGGSDNFITTARNSGVTIPILYKNFVIDEYQLFQARKCGASAVLLIAACLEMDRCRALLSVARQLGLEVLLEMHSESELDYCAVEPDMYGINNRNLGSFITCVENSFQLARLLPTGTVRVSESGISNPMTVKQLREAGFNGFLIGENFMRTGNPGTALKSFIRQL